MSIYKKLNNVMKKVEFVTKDGSLGFGNNRFSIVTHDKVVSVVRPFLVEEGIMVVPTQVEKGVSVAGKTSKGNDKIRFEAVYDVQFIDIDSDSTVTIRTEAHAEDSSDKAANKAITYAVKNALLKVLMLQTGDDMTNEMANKVTPKQATMLQSLVQQTKSDEEKFLALYGAEKYTDIAQDQFSHAMYLLQAKKAK